MSTRLAGTAGLPAHRQLPALEPCSRSCCRSCAPGVTISRGQRHPDNRTTARTVLGGDTAAMCLHNPLADGQPQSGATDAIGTLHAIELVEDAKQVLLRNADPTVCHFDLNQAVSLSAGDLNGRSRRGVLERVLQDVDQYLHY